MIEALLVLAVLGGAAAAPAADRLQGAGATTALHFDWPAIHIGIAEYPEGPTGATVFYFPKPVMAAVDVRGGAPATINTDTLRLAYDSAYVDAVTFAGGSSYGLSVATGAAQEIKTRSANSGDWGNIATVVGAIIFDLGGRRFNTIVPDEALGRAAIRNARPNAFPLGPHGAGRLAMQGGFFGDAARLNSGQGGAFRQVGPTKIAVFTIVNSLGLITTRDGYVARCRESDRCQTIEDRLKQRVDSVVAANQNTTLTLVVVNQKLPLWALQRLAVHVHTSMARAIQPFHTTNDGDVLFAVTTGEVENEKLNIGNLGAIASEVAWDAVLASIPPRAPIGPTTPIELAPAALDRFTGEYELGPGARATVRRDGSRLLVDVTRPGIYFRDKEPTELIAVAPNEFLLQTERRDRIRFDGGGFTLNPGRWEVRARPAREAERQAEN